MLSQAAPDLRASTADAICARLADIPVLVGHAGDMIWSSRDGPLDLERVPAAVLAKSEVAPFLDSLKDWQANSAKWAARASSEYASLGRPEGRGVPPEMSPFGERLEPSARTTLLEAEDSFQRFQTKSDSTSAETVCYQYMKALELQVRHSILKGLADCLPWQPNGLGEMGRVLLELSTSGRVGRLTEYLRENRVSRLSFEGFCRELKTCATKFRNPATHEAGTMSGRDVSEARSRVVGAGRSLGLLVAAIEIHWGSSA